MTFKPRPKQQEVLKYKRGKMGVAAVPGSGKTRTLVYRVARLIDMGIADPDAKLTIEDMAAGDVMFAATGVTDGTMLSGVRAFPGGVITQSIVMRSKTGTVRVVETEHHLQRKAAVVPNFVA